MAVWGLARRGVEKPATDDVEQLGRGVADFEPVITATSGCAGGELGEPWLSRRDERE